MGYNYELEDEYNLVRFLQAQEFNFILAKKELTEGRKRSHWMWYTFPQIKGLGYSPNSKYYAINSLEEAKAYLTHSILGARLRELTKILLALEECNPKRVFGEVDALKLHSSITLFDIVEPYGDFSRLLDKFFSGRRDKRTEVWCIKKRSDRAVRSHRSQTTSKA